MAPSDAVAAIKSAWPMIVEECCAVQAGELHYQAVIYHCLRLAGWPRDQIGMNVKQWIEAPVTDMFRSRAVAKHPEYQKGFEPIPDIVLFSPAIEGNWQRRNHRNTLRHMVCAIEVKASERAGSRLTAREINLDIAKLAAHRDEVAHLGGAMAPVMMVIDVAKQLKERMMPASVDACRQAAHSAGVEWFYAAAEDL